MILKEALQEWWWDDVPRLAASLAFYTVMSLAPLAIIAVAVASLLLGPAAVRGEISGQMAALMGTHAAAMIEGVIEKAWISRSGTVATAISVGIVLITSTAVFAELKHSINSVWGVKEAGSIGSELFARLLSFLVVVGMGVLLLAVLLINAGTAIVSVYLGGVVSGLEHLVFVVNTVLPFIIITVLFAMFFKILPDVSMPWRHAWVGSTITALLFMAGKYLLGFYLSRGTFASAYGAAGSLFVFLVWIYYSAQIFLLGAEITHVYVRHSGTEISPVRGAIPITGHKTGEKDRTEKKGKGHPLEVRPESETTTREVKMPVLVIVVVVVAALVVFSVQNAGPVAVSFLAWHFSASLAIVVFLSLITGGIVMAVISLVIRLRHRRGPQGGTGTRPMKVEPNESP